MALAAALVTDADLLLLDEPTNHLDIEAIAWLAEHLRPAAGAVVAVTHDRWFLDAFATPTWEVVDGEVLSREGGYSDWVFARAERLRLDRAAEERRQQPGPQGVGLAAPRAARPHVQAALPDRGRRGADRGRARAAEHRGAARLCPPPAG